jgi:hypothetical protein
MNYSTIKKRVNIVCLNSYEKISCYSLLLLLNKIFYKLLPPSYKNNRIGGQTFLS